MSEEEKRLTRANLLLELDDQKALVAILQERDTKDREAFEAFAQSYGGSATLSVEGNGLRIGNIPYSFAVLDIQSAVQRRQELKDQMSRLGALQARATGIGIKLI